MKKTLTLLALITILFTACKKETPVQNTTTRECIDKVIGVDLIPSLCTGYFVIFNKPNQYMYTGNDSSLIRFATPISDSLYFALSDRLSAGDSTGLCFDVKPCTR